MDALHVRRLSARYRLPAGDGGARARLDAVLRDVLREALDAAIERAGLPVHEEVCIRHVAAPARLRSGDRDDALAAAWSEALARAIRATLDAGGANVVRYGSRGHALVDLLLAVAAGDLRRTWAWRQMGLWTETDAPPPAAAAEEAARALVSHPESLVSALAEAARRGALPTLAARIRPALWSALARAALDAAGAGAAASSVLASPARALPSVDAGTDDEDDASHPDASPSPAIDRAAARVAATSRIAGAASRLSSPAPEVRRALAVLAALEAEPAEMRHAASAPALIVAVEREMGTAVDGFARVRPASPDRDGSARRNRASDRAPASPESDSTSAHDLAAERISSDAHGTSDAIVAEASADRSPGAARAEDRPASPDARRSDDRGETGGSGRAGSMEAGGDGEGETDPPAVRVEGETRWGGLLCLVHVLGAPAMLDEMLYGPALAARPLRWTLHRLALELVGADERDPAALALAGLRPDRDPPSSGEPDATAEEARAVAALAARVAAETHRRLRREDAPDARAAMAALRDVCARRAAILADPGWIDVRMRLDEVRVDVRRAGLDLDPGWVPWLGVVVRFVYE